MNEFTVQISPHWLNGWFLRLFCRPYLFVDGNLHSTAWGETVALGAEPPRVVGAGVRYFGRGPLLGLEPEEVELGSSASETDLVLRNGLMNHTPFRIVYPA